MRFLSNNRNRERERSMKRSATNFATEIILILYLAFLMHFPLHDKHVILNGNIHFLRINAGKRHLYHNSIFGLINICGRKKITCRKKLVKILKGILGKKRRPTNKRHRRKNKKLSVW